MPSAPLGTLRYAASLISSKTFNCVLISLPGKSYFLLLRINVGRIFYLIYRRLFETTFFSYCLASPYTQGDVNPSSPFPIYSLDTKVFFGGAGFKKWKKKERPKSHPSFFFPFSFSCPKSGGKRSHFRSSIGKLVYNGGRKRMRGESTTTIHERRGRENKSPSIFGRSGSIFGAKDIEQIFLRYVLKFSASSSPISRPPKIQMRSGYGGYLGRELILLSCFFLPSGKSFGKLCSQSTEKTVSYALHS